MRNHLEIISLYGIQVLNGLYPLLVFPFLLQKYGYDQYSDFVKAEVFSMFVLIFVLWGFEIDSVRRLRNIRYERSLGRSLIFFNTLYARFLFWIVSLILSCLFCYIFFDLKFIIMVVGWLFYPLSIAIFSAYYFLVYKLSFEVFIAMFIGRVISLVLLFSLDSGIDLIYISYVISVPLLIVAFCFILLMVYLDKVRYIPFDFARVRGSIFASWSSFKDSLSVSFLKEFNIPIISLASSSSEIISLYSMLDKLLRAAAAMMRPVSQYFMPSVMRSMYTSGWIFNYKFKRVFLIGFSLIALGSIACVFFPFGLIVGDELLSKYSFNIIMSILVFTLLFGYLNYFFLIYSSIVGGYFFVVSVLFSGLIGSVALYYLVLNFQLEGMVLGLFIPEFLLCSICLFYLLLKDRKLGADSSAR